MKQEIHYCTAPDGVSIAYTANGRGPPLVNAASYLRHLEHDRNSPVWSHWLAELERHHTYIRYDERGTGLSEWDAQDQSFEAWVSDLEAVVETVGLDRFALLGISQAGAVAIAYAARHPERVSRLILYGAYARGWLNRDLTPDKVEEEKLLISLMRVGWGRENPAFRNFFTMQLMPEASPEHIEWLDWIMRISTTPEIAAQMESEMHRIDVRDLAPKVKAPTLIIHARKDEGVPFEEGKRLAALIPGAQFVPLETSNHLLTADEPAWLEFVHAYQKFMGVEEEVTELIDQEAVDPAGWYSKTEDRAFSAVLFTDIVDSTAQQRAYGDRRWLELLEEINDESSDLTAAYGGRVIKFTGDGLMAAFPTPGNALRAASAMVSAAKALGLEIRVGLHAGEVFEVEEDLIGTVVTIASRIADQAEASEILTTSVVQSLVEGSNLTFTDRGEFNLKGIGSRQLVRFEEEG
ncbi:MAG: adenylate/guanylate cyclase domain-containing protein [Chloroflexota bacterium]|jgi:pimeloyl-ACP methyl ester carboxylesterase